jgi:hypothetical protein
MRFGVGVMIVALAFAPFGVPLTHGQSDDRSVR